MKTNKTQPASTAGAATKTLQVGQTVKEPGLGCWNLANIVGFDAGGYVRLTDPKHGGATRVHYSRLLMQRENGDWGSCDCQFPYQSPAQPDKATPRPLLSLDLSQIQSYICGTRDNTLRARSSALSAFDRHWAKHSQMIIEYAALKAVAEAAKQMDNAGNYTGGYEGGMKVRGRWLHVTDLNHVDKNGWERVMTGDMTPAMKGCLACPSITAETALRWYGVKEKEAA